MRTRTILAATVLLVGAAACTPHTDSSPANTTTSPSSAAPATSSTTPTPTTGATAERSPGHVENVAPTDEGPIGPEDAGPASAQPGDAEAASSAARDTMSAFLDRSKPADQWWAALGPHLTPAAQDVWQWTDPRRVPEASITGDPAVEDVSATDALVNVPTSIGTYQLTLVRDDAGQPWLVSAIATPEEAAQ